MIPILALVGRPNVGKSTLFNRLTRSRDAIVDDQPGVTRDRLYGRGQAEGKAFLAIDTGGLAAGEGALSGEIAEQVALAVEEAQVVLFMVDARGGPTAADREIATQLRTGGARVLLLVNKSEGLEPAVAVAEFQQLGLGAPAAISASRGNGVAQVLALALADFEAGVAAADDGVPKIALAGRPNVGKSTLANRLAGAARVVVSDTPGTTRDSVRIPLTVGGERLVLIDTAGVRRKSRVSETLEKFSVVKALQAVEEANVVLLLLDAAAEVGTQDAAIAGMVAEMGRSLVLVVNKWERLPSRHRSHIRAELARKLPFLPDPEILFISALHGTNLAQVLPAARRAYRCATISIATASVNRTLADAVSQTPPPQHKRRSIRLKFAHQAGKNPPLIVVHGSQAEKLPANYRRYLANFFARAYRLHGTPVRIIPRSGDNPFLRGDGGKKKRGKE